MATKRGFVTLTVYYHTHSDGRVIVYLSELTGVTATSSTLKGAIDALMNKLKSVSKSHTSVGRDIPWHASAGRPDGWDTVEITMRLPLGPAVRWYQYIIPGLLYAGGWLMVRGITALDDLVKWVESKRRK